jgi:hypothetical protein
LFVPISCPSCAQQIQAFNQTTPNRPLVSRALSNSFLQTYPQI